MFASSHVCSRKKEDWFRRGSLNRVEEEGVFRRRGLACDVRCFENVQLGLADEFGEFLLGFIFWGDVVIAAVGKIVKFQLALL